MASTILAYGFPIENAFPFTTLVKDENGTHPEVDWKELLLSKRNFSPKVELSPSPQSPALARLEQLGANYRDSAGDLVIAVTYGRCSIWMSGALNRPRFFVIATTPDLEPSDEGVFTQVNPLALIKLQTPEVLAQLQRFCADLGIPYQEPGWYLVDSWTEETQEPTEIE